MPASAGAVSRQLVPFPLLADARSYTARTFDYFAPALEGEPHVAYTAWLEMFRSSLAPFQRAAAQDASVAAAPQKAARFAETYSRLLDLLEADPTAALEGYGRQEVSCVYLCKLREDCLRSAGFHDIYAAVKQRENERALQLLPAILSELDAEADEAARLAKVLRGVFAGNIFDLGAEASARLFEQAGPAFVTTRESLVPRPWAVDDFDAAIQRLRSRRYRKAIVFVDNAGSDVVLGMLPLMRELLARGTRVVAAANSLPSINDVTAAELRTVISAVAALDPLLRRAAEEQLLTVVESGSDLPVIDLSQVSPALAAACEGADLVVLEGMGRSIETNLHAALSCDRLNLGMVKHPEVATMLRGRLYDCVCKLELASL